MDDDGADYWWHRFDPHITTVGVACDGQWRRVAPPLSVTVSDFHLSNIHASYLSRYLTGDCAAGFLKENPTRSIWRKRTPPSPPCERTNQRAQLAGGSDVTKTNGNKWKFALVTIYQKKQIEWTDRGENECRCIMTSRLAAVIISMATDCKEGRIFSFLTLPPAYWSTRSLSSLLYSSVCLFFFFFLNDYFPLYCRP